MFFRSKRAVSGNLHFFLWYQLHAHRNNTDTQTHVGCICELKQWNDDDDDNNNNERMERIGKELYTYWQISLWLELISIFQSLDLILSLSISLFIGMLRFSNFFLFFTYTRNDCLQNVNVNMNEVFFYHRRQFACFLNYMCMHVFKYGRIWCIK